LAVVVGDVWLACLLKPFLREAGHCGEEAGEKVQARDAPA
jgi:hypothetical protein